jgi:ribosomal protein S18 acetylase RimI-like enzyme
MIESLKKQDLENFLKRPLFGKIKGWVWKEKGRVRAVLAVNPLGGNDWGSEGILGEGLSPEITEALLQRAFEDLPLWGARLFICFSELPGLKKAGELLLLEAPGREGFLSLATDKADDSPQLAELVRSCQIDSIDFPEIPAPSDLLDAYRGHGDALWRRWENKGVLLLNPVDNACCHLAFVGLKPDMRQQGYGQRLIEDALKITGKDRFLTTAVDIRNTAARRIYEKLDFKIKEQRPVHFATLPKAS